MLFSTSILNNVAAEINTYTVDDDGSSISIYSDQEFNVSLLMGGSYIWDVGSYDSSNLEIVDEGLWLINPNPGSYYYFNWTFKGRSAGTTLLTFNHMISWEGEDSIDNTTTLNVTVIKSDQPINTPLIIIIVAIIGVVPGIIIYKWMKGERKHEK